MAGGKSTEQSRDADFVGPPVDPDLDKFSAEGIGDLVLHLAAADHPHLALMHRAERTQRRAVRFPLAIFLDDADAERIERLRQIERMSALCGLRARRLPDTHRLFGLVDQ